MIERLCIFTFCICVLLLYLHRRGKPARVDELSPVASKNRYPNPSLRHTSQKQDSLLSLKANFKIQKYQRINLNRAFLSIYKIPQNSQKNFYENQTFTGLAETNILTSDANVSTNFTSNGIRS